MGNLTSLGLGFPYLSNGYSNDLPQRALLKKKGQNQVKHLRRVYLNKCSLNDITIQKYPDLITFSFDEMLSLFSAEVQIS